LPKGHITTGGGYVASESADGRYLYYKNAGAGPLWRIPVAGGAPTKVIDSVASRVFTATLDGIYFTAGVAAVSTPFGPLAPMLRYFDFATSTVRVVATLPGLPSHGTGANAAISPDGRWALYSRFEYSGTNLMLVENFR